MPNVHSTSYPDATLARCNKTTTELLQMLSEDMARFSEPFNQAFVDFMTRANVLGGSELRMLIYYAGWTLKARTGALDKMLLHRKKHGDLPPLVLGAGAGKAGTWICRLCELEPLDVPGPGPVPFVGGFQRVARHITSHHWELRSWDCPEDWCDCAFQLRDSFNRHRRQHHNSTGQPNSTPSTQAETTDTISEFQQSVDITPELPASTSDHAPVAVDRSGQGRSSVQPHPYDPMPYAQVPLVGDRSPAPLVWPFPHPVPNSPPRLYGVGVSMNSSPRHVTNLPHQSHFAGDAQYIQTNTASSPVAHYHQPQGNRTRWNTSGRFFDHPAFMQPGSSSQPSSNIAGGSRTNPAHPNHSRGHYTPTRNETHQQAKMRKASSSFGGFGQQQFADPLEEAIPGAFYTSRTPLHRYAEIRRASPFFGGSDGQQFAGSTEELVPDTDPDAELASDTYTPRNETPQHAGMPREFRRSVDITPEFPASTSDHARVAVDWSDQGRSSVQPHPYDPMPYAQVPLVGNRLPAPLVSPFPHPLPNSPLRLYGIGISMNSSLRHVTNVPRQSHLTGDAQYTQTNAANPPVAQYRQPQGNRTRWNIPDRFFDQPASGQPGPSSQPSSNIAGGSITNPAHPDHSRGYYTPTRNETHQQAKMRKASSSFGGFGWQQFAGSTEELAPDTFNTPRNEMRRHAEVPRALSSLGWQQFVIPTEELVPDTDPAAELAPDTYTPRNGTPQHAGIPRAFSPFGRLGGQQLANSVEELDIPRSSGGERWLWYDQFSGR